MFISMFKMLQYIIALFCFFWFIRVWFCLFRTPFKICRRIVMLPFKLVKKCYTEIPNIGCARTKTRDHLTNGLEK